MSAKRTVVRLCVVLAVVVPSTVACGARAEVRTPTDTPALLPATPPERVIVPAPERPTLPDPDPPSTPTGTSAPPRAPQSQAPPRTPPASTTAPPTTEVGPPPVLSTSANTADFERRIREQLKRAEDDLARVNRAALSANARAQYDAARGFIRQCESALRVRNLVFAGQLADKAATMAALLRR